MLTASFYWLARSVPRPLAGCLAALPVVVTAVPSLLLANQLNLLNVSDSTAHTLGVNLPRLRLIINMLVLLLVGARVSGRSGGVYRPVVPHLARFGRLRSAQRTAGEHAAGATLMLMADVLTRAGLPRRSACRRSAGADWQSLLCLAGEEARMKIALVISITLARRLCAVITHMG
ncbi:hypothetical protein EAN89_26680 [Klebsiella pneumoniae]|nr:hypothetical protein EAN89_26680 [Klebsiella pneumoniae]